MHRARWVLSEGEYLMSVIRNKADSSEIILFKRKGAASIDFLNTFLSNCVSISWP